MQIYIICGYGLPKDIRDDQNYLTYLHVVFNTIYSASANQQAALIPCGGPTSCEPPYDGTEARLMGDYLKQLMKQKESSEQTGAWQVYHEDQSLSTLENLVFAKKLLEVESLDGPVTVFCEKTREERVKAIAEHVFEGQETTIVPVDFDISKNRYLDSELIAKKESVALQEAFWSLERPERMQRHHELFEKKFAFLRERQGEGVSHVDAVAEWVEVGPKILKELMPDHPLLSKNTNE